jgi:hypothetical protein
MKKLIIICEGQTEQMFCDKILKNHFIVFNIEIEYPLIAHSGGGIVKWEHLKPQIEAHYSTDNEAFITTFIDYYGIEAHHAFPEWAIAHLEQDKSLRMDILENGMLHNLNPPIQAQFISNIQLHEFEALVLSDYSVFEIYYAPNEYNNAGLIALCANDPEMVNNGITSAPSKRLHANIPGYDKVNDGPELAILIGLNKIRIKCPRFNAWLAKLEGI